jgi:hypothetical protein
MDERFRLMMFQKSGSIHIAILGAIADRFADVGARQDFVIRVLPLHRQRSQMPVLAAGNARAIRVGALMTSSAVQRRHAFAFGASDNVKRMAVPVIALLRILGGGVAIDATGMR